MATVSVTNHYVNPSENDVNGGTSGAGRILTEDALAKLVRNASGTPGYVISGFTPPVTGSSNRTQNIVAGIAVIDGYAISGTAVNALTFSASLTEYWWLQVLFTSSKAIGLQFTSTSSATTYAANAIPLWAVTCNSTDVTAVVDRRPGGKRIYGTVDASGNIVEHGSGHWSVSKGATGAYTLTFATSYFLRKPITLGCSSEVDKITSFAPSSATACAVSIVNSIGAAADAAFTFHAMI